MKTLTHITAVHIIISVFFVMPILTFAATTETFVLTVLSDTANIESVRFNNENWFTIPHPPVASFTMFPDGSAEGTTATGVTFTQYNVPNIAGIRVQRFEIQDHYHYIVDGEIVETFAELSALLALAYHNQQPQEGAV